MRKHDDCTFLLNKLAKIEDKFFEIETISKMLDIWVKDNNYELIPILKILNNKTSEMAKIIRG